MRISLVLLLAPAVFAATCEELANLKLADTTITTQYFATGAFVSAPAPAAKGKNAADPFKDLPAFCRVALTVKPTSDSDIKIEYWLPAAATCAALSRLCTAAICCSISLRSANVESPEDDTGRVPVSLASRSLASSCSASTC